MKKVMITVIVSVALLFALLLFIGLMLPRQMEFLKTAELKSPPDKVFKLVTDFRNQAAWRNDVKSIQVIDELTWTEVPHKGPSLGFRVAQKEENKFFRIDIVEPKTFRGYWTGSFHPSGTGTRVEFREVIEISNPFLRIMSRLFVDLDATMELYLKNMKEKLGEESKM